MFLVLFPSLPVSAPLVIPAYSILFTALPVIFVQFTSKLLGLDTFPKYHAVCVFSCPRICDLELNFK